MSDYFQVFNVSVPACWKVGSQEKAPLPPPQTLPVKTSKVYKQRQAGLKVQEGREGQSKGSLTAPNSLSDRYQLPLSCRGSWRPHCSREGGLCACLETETHSVYSYQLFINQFRVSARRRMTGAERTENQWWEQPTWLCQWVYTQKNTVVHMAVNEQ